MENENNNNLSGELNGFDSVENENNGYTVTPDGGFYVKQKEDIIQDEVNMPKEPEKDPIPDYSKNDFAGYNTGFTPPVPPKKKKKSYGAGVVAVAAVLAAIIGAVSSIAVAIPLLMADTDTVVTEQSQNKVNITVDKTAENVVEAVAEKLTPSVVGIRTTTSVMSFFGGTQESSGDGSGVVYSSNGYIVTNYHVISSALSGSSGSKIEVFLDKKASEGISATVVGYNISADLAVIKINSNSLTAVEFGNSDNLKVGQQVITIGNPGGLEFMDSVTTGVISGLNRVVSSDSGVELIQTDAAINPGNSGGALVDINGSLVGINSAKIVSEEFEGMGFAIPSNTVKKICEDIIDRENSPEPYVGISISERYTAEVLEYYGYPNGAVVLSVAVGSPAQDAGIRKGDIITQYDGKKISEYTILENEITNSKPGEKVTVQFYRSGRYYTTEVTVGSNNAID